MATKRRQQTKSRHLLQSLTQLRTSSAEHLAFCLDAALAASSTANDDYRFTSHFIFTVNVYHCQMDKSYASHDSGGGRRSRLHFLDLGSCTMATNDPSSSSLSVAAVGDVVMAIMNDGQQQQQQQQLPYGQWKLVQLISECMENRHGHFCSMVVGVSSAIECYNETIDVLELAANIARSNDDHLKKPELQLYRHPQTDDESSGSLPRSRSRSRMHRGIRMGLRGGELARTKGSYSDTDHYASESDQSGGGETIIYLGNNIRHSVAGRKETDVRRAVTSRKLFNQSNNNNNNNNNGSPGFRSYNRFNVSVPERELSQCCRHGMIRRQPTSGGEDLCHRVLGMGGAGGGQRFRLGDDRCCQTGMSVSSCEVESEGRSFGRNVVGARRAGNNYSAIGVTGGESYSLMSRCGESRESSLRFRGESGFCAVKPKRMMVPGGASGVYERPRFGQVWVDGPSSCVEPWGACPVDAVSNCSNTLRDEERGGGRMVSWTSVFPPTSGCGQLDYVRSVIGKTSYHMPLPQAPLCCHHSEQLYHQQSQRINPGAASSYRTGYCNRRVGGLSSSRSDQHHSSIANRKLLCAGKHGSLGVRTLPSSSSRNPDVQRWNIGPSSFVDVGGMGTPPCLQRVTHSRCNGSLVRPTARRPGKSVTDRTALWVKTVQGYRSDNFLGPYEQNKAGSNYSCSSQELVVPQRHLTVSESSAFGRSVKLPSTEIVDPPLAFDDSLCENIGGQDVEQPGEVFEPGRRSAAMVDDKLWYTAEELTQLGFEVFPKRKAEMEESVVAVTPVSQHSTYDEDLEKELESLCNISPRDSVFSSQSFQVDSSLQAFKGKTKDIPSKISTDKNPCVGGHDFPSEIPTKDLEKEDVSQFTPKICDSLSERSLALPDGSSNPTIFEKSQSSPGGNDDILCKTESFVEKEDGGSVECRVDDDGVSPDESVTDRVHFDVECLLPEPQTFYRSLSCDVQTGERSHRRTEISNVLKAHGDAVSYKTAVTEQPPGDSSSETGSGNNLRGDGRRFERKARSSTEQLASTLKVPAASSVQPHRRSTSSLISAISSALRFSTYSEKSKPGSSWRRCHSQETSVSSSCEPPVYPTKGEKEVCVPAEHIKNRGQKRVGKSNIKTKMDEGSRRLLVGNCCIPVSTSIPTTVADVSSGYESTGQGGGMEENSTPSRHPTRKDVCSDSTTSESSYGKGCLERRCTDKKGDASYSRLPAGIDGIHLDSSSGGARTNIRKKTPDEVTCSTAVCPSLHPLPIATYGSEEVERMEKWSRNRRTQRKETRQGQDELKVKLVKRRDQLKEELVAARKLLTTSDFKGLDSRIADDSHSAGQLEKEIQCLAQLVAEYKTRIMIVTCFDSNVC